MAISKQDVPRDPQLLGNTVTPSVKGPHHNGANHPQPWLNHAATGSQRQMPTAVTSHPNDIRVIRAAQGSGSLLHGRSRSECQRCAAPPAESPPPSEGLKQRWVSSNISIHIPIVGYKYHLRRGERKPASPIYPYVPQYLSPRDSSPRNPSCTPRDPHPETLLAQTFNP